MLAILTSHPIQYQVPIWRALAASDSVPFEVWYLTDHGVKPYLDVQFGERFAWDLEMLGGYPHRFLRVNSDWNLRRFRGVKLCENLAARLKEVGARALWVEGWRFSALWTAVACAKRAGVDVWLRGESNDLKTDPCWKRMPKRMILGRHFRQIDRFLCIGSANRRLYESYRVPHHKLVAAPYCVDNDRFAEQATQLRGRRQEIRARWRIPPEAFCVLFCGKFIEKKHPMDVVLAAKRLQQSQGERRPIHVLFVGAGALGNELRKHCRIAFDVEPPPSGRSDDAGDATASFVGFLNQTEIPAAYVAADALVLPSDAGETWGLVVNEAMACGLPAIVSDQCGCAEDLSARVDPHLVFRRGDIDDLARAMTFVMNNPVPAERIQEAVNAHHLKHTVASVVKLYRTTVECLRA